MACAYYVLTSDETNHPAYIASQADGGARRHLVHGRGAFRRNIQRRVIAELSTSDPILVSHPSVDDIGWRLKTRALDWRRLRRAPLTHVRPRLTYHKVHEVCDYLAPLPRGTKQGASIACMRY